MRVDQAWLDNYNNKKGVVSTQQEEPKLTEDPKYRSTWESDYAQMLEYRKKLRDDHTDKIVNWMHEPLKLKLYIKVTTKKGKTTRKSTYYIPDFMIEHVDGSMELVEVKGYERPAGELKYFQAVNTFKKFIWRKVGKENGAWVDIHFKGKL